MLRIAIVGCGKIADQHVAAIRRLAECSIIAVCDREILMADQLAERFHISERFADAQEMIASAKPDVVHITTPPESHFALAHQCLQAGCHVYIEKPFTVSASEAEQLISLAREKGAYITAGHNLQFTLEMLQMRKLVRTGFLGGEPVHLESYFSYSLEDTSYVGPMLGSKSHWVRQLPGQLFHNIISHGIARLAEFLDDELAEISAISHQSQRLRALGGEEVLDELRVLVRDRTGITAFFCFSTQIAPSLNQFRICGPKNSLLVDFSSGCLLRETNGSFKSYLTFFAPPLVAAQEYLRNALSNLKNFATRKLHQDAGMKELIEQFYASIRQRTEPPIPYREIILTARIMDEIFAQVYPQSK